MTVNDSKGRVLVTGANGYIAGHIINALLKAGYPVRGTVRSRNSASGLSKALGERAKSLEIVEVPDITVDGAFDEATKGTSAVIHVASPVNVFEADPEEFMNASLYGLTRALEAAQKEQSTVRSFTLMSSVGSITSLGVDKGYDYTYTENNWNTSSEQVVAEKGKNAPGPMVYEASKVTAERAMWRFRDEHKPKFTVTAVNPILCAGPSIVPPSSPDQISISTKMIWNVFSGEHLDKAALPIYQGYVDVRDVARFVLFAVEHPEKTDNELFLLARYYSPPQAVADVLRKHYPERGEGIKEGTPGEGYSNGYKFPSRIVYDGSKAVRVTGQEYTPWEETVVDTAESLKHLLL